MTIGPAPMIMIDSMSVRFGMARPCALRRRGRQRPPRKNDGRSPCPAGVSRRIQPPKTRNVVARKVRKTELVRKAGAQAHADSENEGSTPCPAVGARFGLEDPRPSHGAAGRVAAVMPPVKV